MFIRSFVFGLMVSTALFCTSEVYGEEISADKIHFETTDGKEIAYNEKGEKFTGSAVLKDDEEREMMYVFRNGLKHGVALSHYADGKIEYEITYASGMKNGEEILFSANGLPQYKKTYKDDVLNGEYIIFYPNGKPKQKSIYINGNQDGETYFFAPDGQISRIENYQNGKKQGAEKVIENQTLVEENIYVNGKLNGLSKRYNAKYLTDEIHYANGEKNGVHKHFFEDGGFQEVPYVHNQKSGQAIRYYPNKKMFKRVEFLNDKRNGLSEQWDENGTLKVVETYKNDRKDGISRTFDENGNLSEVRYYIDNTPLAVVNIWQDEALRDIYQAYSEGLLNEYSNKKQYWYKILWLGLNTGQTDILDELAAQMQMFGHKISDTEAYRKISVSAYENDNRNLFFGLTPLSYAINLAMPAEILQQLSASAEQVNEFNVRGTTALQEAVRLNHLPLVQYLLATGADVHKLGKDGRTIIIDAVSENVRPEIIETLLKAGADANVTDEKGQNAVLLAMKHKNIEIMKLLKEYDADLNIKQPNGESLLNYAINKEMPTEIVTLLISGGADVNATDVDGSLPLIKAIEQNNIELLQQLLDADADVHKTDERGENALSYILRHSVEPEIEELVLSHNTDLEPNLPYFNRPLWQVLAMQNRLEQLQKVLDKTDITKADTNETIPMEWLLSQKENPQLSAMVMNYVKNIDDDLMGNVLKNKDAATLRILVEKGGNTNALVNGEPLLVYAVDNGLDKEILEVLDNGSLNVDAVGNDDKTALQVAVEKNNIAAVEFLLQHGATANLKINGDNLLMITKYNQDEITKILLKQGADTDYINPQQQTVLMRAVANLNEILVNEILQKKADISAKDGDGKSAIHYLADAAFDNQNLSADKLKQKIKSVAEKLQKAGADINATNGNGETVLIILAKKDYKLYEKLFKTFEELGINSKLKDQYGKTAADYKK